MDLNGTKEPISLEELTNGYCLVVANAYRLVEDGEKLYGQNRFIGAAGLFRDAINEIVKAHLIQKAVMLDDEDREGWKKFWDEFLGWNEKLDVLSDEIHPMIYKSEEAHDRYLDAHRLLQLDFTRLTFDSLIQQFMPPGGNPSGQGDDSHFAKILYEYVLGLFHAFNFGGLPDPKSQYRTFQTLKTYPDKVK